MHDEHGVALLDYTQRHVDSVHFNCQLCMNLFTDTMKLQQRYLKSFKQEYFCNNDKKSAEIIRDSSDAKWVGLSIDILME